MKINVAVLEDKPYPDGKVAEMHEIEIPDDQLLKLGRKYFELASNPVTSTYVNEQPDLGAEATISTTLIGDHPVNGRTYLATYNAKTGIPVRYSHEDILNMAVVISRFCGDRSGCEGCPFYTGRYPCSLSGSNPTSWELPEEED